MHELRSTGESLPLPFRTLNRPLVSNRSKRRPFWLTRKGIMIVDDCSLKLLSEKDCASWVKLKDTITIKPRHLAMTPAYVAPSKCLLIGKTMKISPLENATIIDEPGLELIDGITYMKDDHVLTVTIVNYTDKTVRINKGCKVGVIHTVALDEELEKTDTLNENTVSHVRTVYGRPENISPTGGMHGPDREHLLLQHLQMSYDHSELVKSLVIKNQDLFALSDFEIGRTKTIQMNIDTGTNPPVRLKPYRTPLNNRQTIEQAIENMLKAGLIVRSLSSWSSPVVLVTKAGNSKRFCCDYRKLNEITQTITYPIPNVDDILSTLAQSNYFTTLDAKSGFWCVPIAEEDQHKTAFATFNGKYQWKVMPFGLKNAPATFVALMNILLQGMDKYAIAYIEELKIHYHYQLDLGI